MEVGWIDELKHDEVCQEKVPMRIEAHEQPLPIQVLSVSEDNVIDVGAIVPLPVLHVRLAPEQLLGGEKLYGDTGKFSFAGMSKPAVIDLANVVDGVENYVDEVFSL